MYKPDDRVYQDLSACTNFSDDHTPFRVYQGDCVSPTDEKCHNKGHESRYEAS